MLIPNTAQIVDFTFNLLELKLSNAKKTAIDSRSDFQKQNELFREKSLLIASALSADNSEIWLYIDHTMGTLQAAMLEINSSLEPLSMDELSKQKNRIAFISYWCIPYAIAAISKLDTMIESESALGTIRCWLKEILEGSEDTRDAIKSKSIDVEAFICRKLSQVIPRGVSGDIKSDLASNKGWKSISYCDDQNQSLLKNIKIDLVAANEVKLVPKVTAIVKAGGVLRRALKGVYFKDLAISNADEVISTMDNYLISFEQMTENLKTGRKTDSTETFLSCFRFLDANLIKENNPQQLVKISAVNNLINVFPQVAADNGIEYILLILHESMGSFEHFDSSLLTNVLKKCKNADDDVYNIIISNAHEQVRQEFTNFIEDLEHTSVSKDQVLTLSCIVLTLSSVFLQTVQHNKMTKLIAIIRRNLRSCGDFSVLPPFSTCFNRKSSTVIDFQRFNEDSQIFTYAIKNHNKLLIQNLHRREFSSKVISPLWHMDIQLEEFVDSYSNGKFDKKKVKALTSSGRFWRVDTSSAYEVLRDIDFYIDIFGVKIDEKDVVLVLGLNKYYNLSDKKKKKALKVLDPIQYGKDEAELQRSVEAKKNGKLSYIGSDDMPVFILKSEFNSK
jgi:hypothetical protein